jgi:hypothetical protein
MSEVMMFREVLILGSSAVAGYAWLCAIASPVVRSIQSLWPGLRPSGAWRALALAAGGALVWTVIGAGAILLFMMLEPRVGLALVGSVAWLPGFPLGGLAWSLQAFRTGRVPRIGDHFEVATALALTALAEDDPRTLARVEHLYRAHALPHRARSGGVLGVAT